MVLHTVDANDPDFLGLLFLRFVLNEGNATVLSILAHFL